MVRYKTYNRGRVVCNTCIDLLARARTRKRASGSHRSRNALHDKDFLSPSRDKMCYMCDAMAPTCALALVARLGDLVPTLPRRSPAFTAPEVANFVCAACEEENSTEKKALGFGLCACALGMGRGPRVRRAGGGEVAGAAAEQVEQAGAVCLALRPVRAGTAAQGSPRPPPRAPRVDLGGDEDEYLQG